MQTAWKGNLSFGLVTLPVRMHKATTSTRVSFRTLHAADRGTIHEKRVCDVCGKEVDYKDTVKGYEVAPDRYVPVTREELASLEPESSTNLDVREFVDLADLDPIYFDRTYVLSPDKGGAKAYGLLASVLRTENKAAIGKVATRGREHLAAIRPGKDGDLLYVEILHFPEEVRDLAEVRETLPAASPTDEEREIAKMLVDRLTKDWEPGRYHDEYQERVREFVEKKAAGEPIEAIPPSARPPTKDLLEALRASLERAQKAEA